jgi:hypothetical protein
MKLHAEIADRKYAVNIHDDGVRVFAAVEGRRYELEVPESGPNGYLLISQGRVFNCRIDGRPESGKKIDVIVGTTNYAVTLTDPRRLGNSTAASAHGDGIIVVEAMKMQNEMKSPKAGTVIALNTQAGATVNGGDVLAVIE